MQSLHGYGPGCAPSEAHSFKKKKKKNTTSIARSAPPCTLHLDACCWGHACFSEAQRKAHKKGMTSKAVSPLATRHQIAVSLAMERGRREKRRTWHVHGWEGGRLKKKKMAAKSLRSLGILEGHLLHAPSRAFARHVPCQLKSVTPRCEFEYLWVVSRASLHNSKAVYFGLRWPPRFEKRWWNMKTDAHSVVRRIIRRETSVSPPFVLHCCGLHVPLALRHGPHLFPGSHFTFIFS